MESENKSKIRKVENGGLVGCFWSIGWRFTLAYANLDWEKRCWA